MNFTSFMQYVIIVSLNVGTKRQHKLKTMQFFFVEFGNKLNKKQETMVNIREF